MNAHPINDKAILRGYLREGTSALLGKLDGVSDYDARRPMTPTGTNLLGLVKHVASVQLDYFGLVFGRPSGRALPWLDDDAPRDADMWATADESRASIIELHHLSVAHSDATIDALALDAGGDVPWWSEAKRRVTLHQILTHVTVEAARHAGHADIIREMIDGEAGMKRNDPNLSSRSPEEWAEYRAELERTARIGK